MKSKNDVDVLINGRKYTLCGFESADYIQKVATYINSKLSEFQKKEYYANMDIELKNILLAINIADDYFKAKKQISILEEELQGKEKELYDLKHELISVQIKLENADKALDKLKEENKELQMKIVQLETEIKNNKEN